MCGLQFPQLILQHSPTCPKFDYSPGLTLTPFMGPKVDPFPRLGLVDV